MYVSTVSGVATGKVRKNILERCFPSSLACGIMRMGTIEYSIFHEITKTTFMHLELEPCFTKYCALGTLMTKNLTLNFMYFHPFSTLSKQTVRY